MTTALCTLWILHHKDEYRLQLYMYQCINVNFQQMFRNVYVNKKVFLSPLRLKHCISLVSSFAFSFSPLSTCNESCGLSTNRMYHLPSSAFSDINLQLLVVLGLNWNVCGCYYCQPIYRGKVHFLCCVPFLTAWPIFPLFLIIFIEWQFLEFSK